ncbi:alpha-galactosidase [Luteolibacter sp. GHJ8]|uniref:alpha-galactosidase n=1 Tax=Luteolibacter rhizosphaerae TaxID=2989719 RepID=A0ABT3GAX4_9BACT|nr:alpha-galactosidase [Luteolibacter rhizosphaerae]MCW1916987.1 alpha-galactosidase [Luteolibacter rhizosphaerae]
MSSRTLILAAAVLLPAFTAAAETTDLATLPSPENSITQGWAEARANRSVDGNPLRVGGKTYESGIGTHANAEWPIALGGEATALRGASGVDDEVGEKASVVFIIEGDGKVLWKSPVMKKGDAAQPFAVKLDGVKALRLVVNDGGDGSTEDHGDWLDLKLEHSGKALANYYKEITVETAALAWTFSASQGKLEQRRFGLKSDPDKTRAPGVYAYPDYIDRNADVALLEPTLDVLGADGLRNLALRYDSQEVTKEGGKTRTDIRLKDEVSGMRVVLHFLAHEKEDVIETWCTIVNGSKEAVTLLRFDSFAFSLGGKDLHLTTFRGGWGDEMNWSEAPVSTGLRRIGNQSFTHPTHGYSSSFVVSEGAAQEESGKVVAGSLAWSGNWHLDFQSEYKDAVRVSGGIHPFQPQHLAAGAELVTPRLILTVSGKGKGAASRNLHRWAKHSGMRQVEVTRPVILNSWDGAYFNFDEKRLLAMMDAAVKSGVEMFVLDDGWFGNGENARNSDTAGLGDWQVNREKLPHDIQWLAEQAHERGLKFGLWVEPEMVNPRSELFAKHPDWAVKLPGREQRLGRNQLPLDLSKPEVEEFAYKVVADILDRYPGIEYIKWDNNGHLQDAGSQGAKPAGQMNMTTEMTRAYYRILDRLVAKYPKIIFQDCASGGGRAEYGSLPRHAEFWASDNQNPLKRLQMHWGYSHFFPPMSWGAHIAESFDSGKFPMKFRIDVAMTARLGVELDPSHLKADQLEEMRAGIEVYKRLRPLLHAGEVFRGVSPYAADVCSSAVVAEDKARAVFFAFRTKDHGAAKEGRVKVPGLDAAKRYRVSEAHVGAVRHVQAGSFSGQELMEQGLPLSWSTGPESAVVEIMAE